MVRKPMRIKNDTLLLLTADNKLIYINIRKGEIIKREKAFETLSVQGWPTKEIKRKDKKVKYPKELPKLENGHSIAQDLWPTIRLMTFKENIDSSRLAIDCYNLTIDILGKCEVAGFAMSKTDRWGEHNHCCYELTDSIGKWIKHQTFETRTIPRKFPKFEYSGRIIFNWQKHD